MIMTIQRYYASRRFGKYLIECDLIEELSQKTMTEMQQLLHDIRFAVQNRNSSDMIQKGVPQVICAVEPLVCRFINIRGTSAVLAQNEVFKDLLEEYALENQIFSDTPASTRLAYEAVKTMVLVNGMHRASEEKKKAVEEVKEKPVSVSPLAKDLL
jgi:hypothetical protein